MSQFMTELPEISMDGFQVVSSDMFSHIPYKVQPNCTLWNNSISFGKNAVEALNNCERIRIEVNIKTRCVLIIPVTTSDRDGVRWVSGTSKKHPRKIECKAFTSQLFTAWSWDTDCVYRTNGKIVTTDQKVMLLFDFNDAVRWKSKASVKE